MTEFRRPLKTEFGNGFEGRRVLVTGATGFLGWHLCRALTELGAEVSALSRRASPESVPVGCRPMPVDLTEIDVLRRAVSESQPQIVYHLASAVDARQEPTLVMPMLQANLIGSVHLAQVCNETGCEHLVAVGSSEEPGDDDHAPAPLSPYAAAKASASLYFRMFHRVYGLPVVIVRPTLGYGPHQASTKLIPYAIALLLKGAAPQIGSGQRVCDFVFVADVVRGLCRAGIVRDQFGQTFDLGTGVGTTIRQVIELLVELTEAQVVPQFASQPDRVGEHPRIANVEQTKRALGFEPLWSLRDGLSATIEAHRQSLAVQS